jgi:hypothetical protein
VKDAFESDWFSDSAKVVMKIARRECLEKSEGINELLQTGVNIGFGICEFDKGRELLETLEPKCSFCCANLRNGSGPENMHPDDPPLLAFLTSIGAFFQELNAERPETAYKMIFIAGNLWGEIEAQNKWEKDAIRGGKVIGGARNSAQEVNNRHAALRDHRFTRIRNLMSQNGLNLSCAAAQCEVDGLGPAQSILRQWHRQKKSDT